MRFILGSGKAPDSVVRHLKSCLEELRKTTPKVEDVTRMARAANVELGKFCERIHLAHVVGVQGSRAIVLQIQSILAMVGERDLPHSKDLKVVLDRIRKIEELVQNPNFEPAEIRVELKKLHEKLAQTSSLLKTQNLLPMMPEAMDTVAGNLERLLRAERVMPMDLAQALENLILDLKPSKAVKRCRPYELFLFAAQNKLRQLELVRVRSALAPGVIIGPPHRGSLPILMSHRGAEIAMGIRDPR